MENRAESHFILFLQNLENDILPQLTPQYQNQLQMGVTRYLPALEIKTQWPWWPCSLSFLDFCTSKDDNCITYLMSPVHSISVQIQTLILIQVTTQECMTPSFLANPFKTNPRALSWSDCSVTGLHVHLRVAILGTDTPHLCGRDYMWGLQFCFPLCCSIALCLSFGYCRETP